MTPPYPTTIAPNCPSLDQDWRTIPDDKSVQVGPETRDSGAQASTATVESGVNTERKTFKEVEVQTDDNPAFRRSNRELWAMEHGYKRPRGGQRQWR